MDHLGIDVHKKASRVCIRTETGQLIERRVRTDREPNPIMSKANGVIWTKPTPLTRERLPSP